MERDISPALTSRGEGEHKRHSSRNPSQHLQPSISRSPRLRELTRQSVARNFRVIFPEASSGPEARRLKGEKRPAGLRFQSAGRQPYAHKSAPTDTRQSYKCSSRCGGCAGEREGGRCRYSRRVWLAGRILQRIKLPNATLTSKKVHFAVPCWML